jgi:hypothetical protein
MADYKIAVEELRQMIADTPLNKRATRKQVTGNTDGENTTFFTWDKRVFEDTLEVYVNGVLSDDASLEDPIPGKIVFGTAPDRGSEIRATYYWQWWSDAELINFLNKGAEQIGIFEQAVTTAASDQAYLLIPPGLKTPTLKFAAHMAQDALVEYLMARKHSGEFLIEQDGNTDEGYAKLVAQLQEQSKQYMKDSIFLADRYYKRQGRAFAPAFGIKNVGTRQYGPTR